jgi:lipid-binding SYLF domain-containing protein
MTMELSLRNIRSKALSTVKKLSPARMVDALKKESEVSHLLHAEVAGTLKRMTEKDPGLAKALEQAYGFAVFPSVGKAAIALGCAYGLGEVFKHGKLVGYAGIVQLTIGVQVGGQTFSELVLFQDEQTLKRFKESKVGFAANASAVLVKAGAATTNHYKGGMQIFVDSEGGLMLELAIGGQKLIYRPAGLTRGKAIELPEEPGARPAEPGEPGAAEHHEPGAGGRLFDGTDESLEAWKLVGSGDIDRTDAELTLAAGPELGLFYYTARRFDDFHLRLQYRPESSDTDMSLAVRFLDPQQPVPDRDDPSVLYPYDNPAYVAAHTGFAVHLGGKRPGAESGTFEDVLLGNAPGAQSHAERAEVKVGDWNDLELDVEGNHFSVRLNGKETAQFVNSDSYRGKPASADPHAGFISLLLRKGRMAVRQIEIAAGHDPSSEVESG